MKKVMMRVFVAAVLCVACQSFSDAVNWYSTAVFGVGGPDIVDRFGVAIPQSSDWAVRILTVGDETEVFAALGSHWSDAGVDGLFFQGIDYNSSGNPFNGANIFTRIYDNADWTLANYYADAGFTTINWPSAIAPAPANEYFYDIGTVGQGVWQAVPEPATFALFGIGGVGAWLVRRNKLQVKEEAEG